VFGVNKALCLVEWVSFVGKRNSGRSVWTEFRRRQIGRVQQKLLSRKLLPHDDLATAAQCDEVEGGLA